MKIIIGGAGAVGTHLSKLLSKDHQDCVLIDDNIERLSGLESRYDIMTLHGSPTSIHTLRDAGVEHADLFVGVTPDESVNMNACMIAPIPNPQSPIPNPQSPIPKFKSDY